jgi:membrane-associated phospholipid phosphatase
MLVPGVFWLSTEVLKPMVAPIRCRWCSVADNRFDSGARDALRWSRPDGAASLSDVVAYGVIPVGILTAEVLSVRSVGQWRLLHEDVLIMVEAVAFAAAINQVVKLSAARARPYAHFSADPIPFLEDPDQNMSFYSGHASLAFSMVTSAGTVASMRGYRSAPVVWGIGVPLATFVTYLRVAGDRHYLSDALIGAAAGALIGFVTPWALHHPKRGLLARRAAREQLAMRLAPYPGGASLTLQW